MKTKTMFALLALSALAIGSMMQIASAAPISNGTNSTNGTSGSGGSNGTSGSGGSNGTNGQNGNNGQNGQNGQNGNNGQNGLNGKNGNNDEEEHEKNTSTENENEHDENEKVIIKTQGGTLSSSFFNNGNLDCQAIASRLGGTADSHGKLCDVTLVRQSPTITGINGISLNQFDQMKSVLEFYSLSSSQVYAIGELSLLDSELNDVNTTTNNNGWTTVSTPNHLISESPETTILHFETQGDINTLIDQANEALAKTTIKG